MAWGGESNGSFDFLAEEDVLGDQRPWKVFPPKSGGPSERVGLYYWT